VQHPPTGEEACCLHLFFPYLAEVHVDKVEEHRAGVRITARTRGAEAACHLCGVSSTRVNCRYRRYLHDLAAGGRPVVIELEARRFFCGNPVCELQTFAEQVPQVALLHQRRTPGLRALLEQVALALAGRAGSRLAGALGVAVSRSTLIRLIRALPDPEIGQVAVLGVDDFAKRRGHSYGTILVNMDTHRPIDVLDDRLADTLAQWLKAHPGVQVICRDRAGAYADGARTGAPQALQVADRWHLWHNLAEALEKTVRSHRACLRDEPEPEPDTEQEPAPIARPETLDTRGDERPLVARTRERYAQVQKLRSSGASLNAISRELGLAFRTARRFANAASVDELLAPALNRSSVLDEFKPYLTRRWNQGCTDGALLHTEIKAQGWTGSLRTVQGYLRPLRGHQEVQVPLLMPAKPRRIAGWIMSHPDHLDPGDKAELEQVLARCPELNAAAGHVRTFATMMTNRDGHLLDEWIAATTAGASPLLASFAAGLRRDHAAVTAGLTLPYSSGAVEGTVNRIKMIKRKMFGRANFDLLRKLILLS
jgi:transposase